MRAMRHATGAASLALVTLLGLALRPAPAHAYFERSEVGARALSLGRSFVSVADDASAVYWNPAGLVLLPRHEAMLAYDQPLDLEGLHSGFAAVVAHTAPVSFGLGWQHTGLESALREDLVYLSAAHTAIRRSLGAYVSVGGTLKLAHVGIDRDGFEDVSGLRGSATRVCGDLGVLLAPIPNVTAGAVIRNLGRPQFDLLEGGERTALANETEWGLSLRWREDAWLHVSRVRHPGVDVRNKLGAEIRIAHALGVRIGFAAHLATGGMGIGWAGWQLDSAFQADDALGVEYRVALRRGFGRKRATVGGEYEDF